MAYTSIFEKEARIAKRVQLSFWPKVFAMPKASPPLESWMLQWGRRSNLRSDGVTYAIYTPDRDLQWGRRSNLRSDKCAVKPLPLGMGSFNGSAGRTCGVTNAEIGIKPIAKALQWGRRSNLRSDGVADAAKRRRLLLQWGRRSNLRSDHAVKRTLMFYNSMLQWGRRSNLRSDRTSTRWRSRRWLRFNGAAGRTCGVTHYVHNISNYP